MRVVAEVEASPGTYVDWAIYQLPLDPEAAEGDRVSAPPPGGQAPPVMGVRRKLKAQPRLPIQTLTECCRVGSCHEQMSLQAIGD